MGLLLSLRGIWPGFESWQAGRETLSPANQIAQSFILEFDSPSFVEFPAVLAKTPDLHTPILTARVTLLSATPVVLEGVPVGVDLEESRLRVPLMGLEAHAGDRLVVELEGRGGSAWLWAVEHDGYPPGERILGSRPGGGDLAFRVYYRRSLFEIGVEGVRVAIRTRGLVLAAMALAFVSCLSVSGALRRVSDLNLAALLSAGVGGGLLLTALLGLSAAMLHVRLSAGLVSGISVIVGLAGFGLWLRPSSTRTAFGPETVVLILIVAFVACLRLAFADPLVLPPHVDSVQHYLLVSDMLHPERLPTGANSAGELLVRYYHLGFHGFAAWVSSLAGEFTPLSLVVLGQLIQTAAILTVYFLVHVALRDGRAALAAVAFAAFAWPMPAYASNWAKYPALLALAALPTVLGVLLIAVRHRPKWAAPLAIAGAMAVVTVTIHTRTAFLIGSFALAIELGERLDVAASRRRIHLPPLRAFAAFAVLLLVVLALATSAGLDAIRQSLRKLADAQGATSTWLLLLLVPFALNRNRKAALAAVASMALIVLLELIPPNSPYPFPLLDPPMASMALPLPMSFLAGLGASGLVEWVAKAALISRTAKFLRPTFLGAAVMYAAWTLASQQTAPAECCLLARQDDLVTVESVSSQLESNARVLIPSFQEGNAGPYAVDGGAWIPALAHRETLMAPAASDLQSPLEHAQWCLNGLTHVYVGGTALSFSRMELGLVPYLYSPILELPGSALYAIRGCSDSRGASDDFDGSDAASSTVLP